MHSIKQPPEKSGTYFLHTPAQDAHPALKHKAHYDAVEGEWSGVVTYWLTKATHWTEIPMTKRQGV